MIIFEGVSILKGCFIPSRNRLTFLFSNADIVKYLILFEKVNKFYYIYLNNTINKQ